MHGRILTTLVVMTLLTVSVPADALQCVPFAREISGISLRGDAWTWWSAAAGQYERGQAPRLGAVVVFRKYGAMRHGHVAVVTRVVNAREVLVDHANWGPRPGQISKMVAVTDVSPHNDWTEVRVWNRWAQGFGPRTYPTYGFIYPKATIVQQAVFTIVQSSPPVRMPSPGQPMACSAAPPAAVEKVPPRPIPADPVRAEEDKPAAPTPAVTKVMVAAQNPAIAPDDPWGDDLALAKRFGSGRY